MLSRILVIALVLSTTITISCGDTGSTTIPARTSATEKLDDNTGIVPGTDSTSGRTIASSGPTPTSTPKAVPYRPPHTRVGPATDRIQFSAVHMDTAPLALGNDDIDFYAFSLKTDAARSLVDQANFRIYEAPATSLSLILNPAPAPEGMLNPFSLKGVRFAIQYLVDRNFVAQEIYKGLAVPMFTSVGPLDFDHLTVFEVLKEYNFAYDPELASDLVASEMRAAGAKLTEGHWHFNGNPIQLKFITRVEDERREVGDLIRSEFEKMGFLVSPVYHQFAPAVLKVYGTDPQLLEWHIYTEGWGRGSADRYDYGTINQMAAPWLGNMPGWQEVGFWQYDNRELDSLGKRIFQGDFDTMDERNQLYQKMTRLSLDESVRIWIATVVNSFPATDDLAGVTEDIVAGPKALWTLREAYTPGQETLRVGNLWVWTERTTWNPVGGFGDVYSLDIWRNLHDPPLARHPFSGNPIPFRTTFEVETAGPDGTLQVPSDAFFWNANASAFHSIGDGSTAISRVTYDYSKFFQSNWHHKQPITMADVIYSIYQSFDIANNENKSRIEFSIAATRKPYLDTIVGFRIVDENKIEIYVNYWHFALEFIAEYASPSALSMPWEMLLAMDELVFSQRRAAYSDTAAQRFGVDWLNLVLDRDSRALRRVLRELGDNDYLPRNVFTIGDSLLVTPEEAMNRYWAALSWIGDHCETNSCASVISNGPYMLTRFDTAAQFAELEAFRDATYPFKPGDWYFGSSDRISFLHIETEPIVAGQTGQVNVEMNGPGNLSLRYLLMDPFTGASITNGEGKKRLDGTFQISLNSEETSGLEEGFYALFLLASSDAISAVNERRVDLEIA